jgi:hypothetical protein
MWPGAPPSWSTETACYAGGRWAIVKWCGMERRFCASSTWWLNCGRHEVECAISVNAGGAARVLAVTHGRRHVDDSFDELGFFQVWHRLIATLELGARQPVAVFQRWHHVVTCLHGHGGRRRNSHAILPLNTLLWVAKADPREILGVGATFWASFCSLHICMHVHKVKLNCSTSAPGRRLLPVERSW